MTGVVTGIQQTELFYTLFSIMPTVENECHGPVTVPGVIHYLAT